MKLINKIVSFTLILFFTFSTGICHAREHTVYIDAGHGFQDSGAVGINGNLEKNWNLDVFKSCKETLEEYGINVVYTRDDDSYLTLRERGDKANNSDAELCISIHFNAGNGDYGLIISNTKDENSRLAKCLKNRLSNIRYNIQIWENNSYYAMCNRPNMPAVIIETCFIDNINDYKYGDTLEERQEIGRQLAYGILDYLGVDCSKTIINNELYDDKTKENKSIKDRILRIIGNKNSSSKDKIEYIKNLLKQ